MPTLRLATSRETRNPVRVQEWNATIRAGDDLRLALTVYADDAGAAAVVAGSRSRLSLWPDDRIGWSNSPDYGLGWYTGAVYGPGDPVQQVTGFETLARAGGINFAMGGAVTANLCGRYRLSVQVDLADGQFSQVEGVLQVREGWARPGLGHVPGSGVPDFTDDFGPDFDPNTRDADGFYMFTADFGPP